MINFCKSHHVVLALALGVACLQAGAQQDYPGKPVRVLTGFPAGQGTDVLGRMVAQKLQENFGQTFFVDNRPGAAGIIAHQMAMSSPTDGYTLLLTSTGPLAVNPGLYSKLPYDPIKDFVPVAGIASIPEVLVASPNFPAASVKEMIALAKAKPGDVTFASAGNGVTNHLIMEMFSGAAGIKLTHVPYKGTPPALTDLMAGQVNVMFDTSVATLQLIKQGRLRALAVTTAKRLAALPDVPTVAELGYPGFTAVPWVVIMAPANTPAPIIAKLNAEINKVLASKEGREYLALQGVDPMPMSPDELGAFLKAEIPRWVKAVKDSGAKVD